MATKPEKLKSGRYRVRASYLDETGKQRFKSFTADTAKEAKYLAASFEITKEHSFKPENKTLKQAIDSFISNRENLLSPATITGYRQLERNAYSDIIETRLGFLTREMVQKSINDYSKNHSAKSVSNAFGLLSSVLKEFYPTLNISGLKLPQKQRKEKIVPTNEEVQELLRITKDSVIYFPLMLGIFLGLRRSEVFALTWEDIDLEANTISITKALVKGEYGYELKEPKTTTSRRVLQLPKIVGNYLREHQGEELFKVDTDGFAKRLRRYANIVGAPAGFHAYRHYYASVLGLNNVPIKYAMERMGHATPNMLNQVYQHTFKSEQMRITAQMDSYFDSLTIEE